MYCRRYRWTGRSRRTWGGARSASSAWRRASASSPGTIACTYRNVFLIHLKCAFFSIRSILGFFSLFSFFQKLHNKNYLFTIHRRTLDIFKLIPDLNSIFFTKLRLLYIIKTIFVFNIFGASRQGVHENKNFNRNISIELYHTAWCFFFFKMYRKCLSSRNFFLCHTDKTDLIFQRTEVRDVQADCLQPMPYQGKP